MSDQDKLEILIDVRSRLEELVKAQAEFRKLREEAGSFGNMLKTGIGIDVARRGLDLLKGTLRESFFESFRLADSIKDSAANLGITTTAYQVLGNVLHDAGGDASLLTMAISQSNRSLVEARTIGSGAAGAYRSLGLDIAQLNAMPVEARFEMIGRAVANASDKTAAFSAASQILGARNLPTVLGALKDLASGGYANLEAAMMSAGRVLEEETIARLDAAGKSIEKFKQKTTIFVGENIGGAMSTWDAAVEGWANDKKGMFEAAGSTALDAFFRPWRLFDFGGGTGIVNWLAKHAPAATTAEPKPGDGGAAAQQVQLAEQMASAQEKVVAAELRRQTVEANPGNTDYQKRYLSYSLLQNELKLREKLLALTIAAPVDNIHGETQGTKDLRITKLVEQNQRLRDQISNIEKSNQFSNAAQDSSERFKDFNSDQRGAGETMGGSLQMGAQDWVTNLGSQGQQVAQALQSSLGATVSGISAGIMGWASGTQSLGASIMNLGSTVFRTFLDTIIQMGVQWLVTQALIKTGMVSTHVVGETLRASRTAGAVAEGATTTAAMAPAAAASSISSFGAAAVLGVVALLAAMAIFGGFATGGYTGDGPTGEIAGVVHGQEHVMTAATTRRLGPAFFDQLNAGGSPGVAAAGSARAFGGDGAAAAGGGGGGARNHYFLFDRAEYARAMQEDSQAWFRDMHASQMRQS